MRSGPHPDPIGTHPDGAQPSRNRPQPSRNGSAGDGGATLDARSAARRGCGRGRGLTPRHVSRRGISVKARAGHASPATLCLGGCRPTHSEAMGASAGQGWSATSPGRATHDRDSRASQPRPAGAATRDRDGRATGDGRATLERDPGDSQDRDGPGTRDRDGRATGGPVRWAGQEGMGTRPWERGEWPISCLWAHARQRSHFYSNGPRGVTSQGAPVNGWMPEPFVKRRSRQLEAST
jgi:hypothetical protein